VPATFNYDQPGKRRWLSQDGRREPHSNRKVDIKADNSANRRRQERGRRRKKREKKNSFCRHEGLVGWMVCVCERDEKSKVYIREISNVDGREGGEEEGASQHSK
jgi:hypothetical protein